MLDIWSSGNTYTPIIVSLRQKYPSIGIIVVGKKHDERKHADTMEQGADYFLARPINAVIFKAVLTALLRRTLIVGETDYIETMAWRFNRRKRTLTSPRGEEVRFSERETAILTTLFMNPHVAVSTDRLLQSLNMHVDLFDPHRIDTIIYRIRRKLREIRHSQLHIKNLYGQGYICIGEEGNARFYILDGH